MFFWCPNFHRNVSIRLGPSHLHNFFKRKSWAFFIMTLYINWLADFLLKNTSNLWDQMGKSSIEVEGCLILAILMQRSWNNKIQQEANVISVSTLSRSKCNKKIQQEEDSNQVHEFDLWICADECNRPLHIHLSLFFVMNAIESSHFLFSVIHVSPYIFICLFLLKFMPLNSIYYKVFYFLLLNTIFLVAIWSQCFANLCYSYEA